MGELLGKEIQWKKKKQNKKKRKKRKEEREHANLDSLNLLFQNSKQLLKHKSEATPLIAVTIVETHKCD